MGSGNGGSAYRDTIIINGCKIPITVRLVNVPDKNAYVYVGEVGRVKLSRGKRLFRQAGEVLLEEACAEGRSRKQVTDRIRNVIKKGLKRKKPEHECADHACASFSV
jgi:hypothetical protein